MSKNILEICLSPDLGGLELFMVNCYQNFKIKNQNCKIVVQKDSKLDNYLVDEDKFYLKRNKLFPFMSALKLAKYIDENSIDIVHFHWTKDMNTVVTAKLLSKRKPKIIQTRNMTMTRFKNDSYHKFLYKNISCIHAVTNQVKEQIEKFIPKDVQPKTKVVYMGAKNIEPNQTKIEELKKAYNLKEDDFIVGIIGRIEEAKGQYIVIEAIEKLKHLNIKALIIGHTMNKKYLNSLKNKINDMNIEDKIIFTGFTKDVNEHLKLLDTNILATKNETFGLVIIEAMINEVCVIATSKGGPLEIIEDKKDGLLFDWSSSDLAKKIEFLYNNNEIKQELAKNAKIKAKEKFNEKIQLDKLYDVVVNI